MIDLGIIWGYRGDLLKIIWGIQGSSRVYLGSIYGQSRIDLESNGDVQGLIWGSSGNRCWPSVSCRAKNKRRIGVGKYHCASSAHPVSTSVDYPICIYIYTYLCIYRLVQCSPPLPLRALTQEYIALFAFCSLRSALWSLLSALCSSFLVKWVQSDIL